MSHFPLPSAVNVGYSVDRGQIVGDKFLSLTVFLTEDILMAFWVWIIGCSVLILGVYGLVLRRLTANKTAPVAVPANVLDWLDTFSAARYRPMERLLTGTDAEYLKIHLAGDRHVARRLRRQRLQIFRQYLSEMKRDFSRLSLAMRELITCAPADRVELVAELIKMEWRFRCNLAEVHLRLGFYTVGLGSLEVAPLVRGFESLETGIRQLMEIPEAALAQA